MSQREKSYVLAAVFARGGSKQVPGKNLREVAGRTLLARAVECARGVEGVDRVIVSTDSEEIAAEGRRAGAEVPFLRPAELATDDAPEWLAWRHAIQELSDDGRGEVGVLLSIPTTAPLRAPGDVATCLVELQQNDCDAVITVTEAARNPHFNMVTVEDGLARLAIPPEREHGRRQEAPPVFDITTVAYAARAGFVRRATSLFEGRVRAVHVPQERALDIDTEWDLELAEMILSRAGRRT